MAATGVSAESVSNAISGMMKGNYTMLDNLNIGIAGTKEGAQKMIDMVNQAREAQGNYTKLTLDNQADLSQALIEYIDLQGLSGYAAAEASTTIQGSIAAMKGAWENWLSGLMDENADIGQLTEDLLSSVGQVVENLKPKVEEFFNNLPEAIHNALEPFPEL